MSRLTVAKLVMAFVGLGVFGWGVRVDDPILRWVGVGLVAAGWLLRLGNRRER